MTGFASITREDDRATIAVTMRSVNHRYLDLQLRVPQALAAIESELRALVGKWVSRGRVEVGLSFQLRQVPGVDVEFNETFGAALEKALEWGDRIPIGVFYKNEHVPTFEERIVQRIPTYMDSPPALQAIAGPHGEPRTDLARLMQRMTFKGA